jgi:hypothetical protein
VFFVANSLSFRIVPRVKRLIAALVLAASVSSCMQRVDEDEKVVSQALANGALAREGFDRSDRYVRAWIERADPASGLIPRNFTNSRDLWNGRDAAADNYPYMVLTTWFTDETLFHGRMKEMLAAEQRLTCRVGRLPDNYVFSTKSWQSPTVDLFHVIFEGSEYAKDGLIPITETIGPSEWSTRMLGIVDDVWSNATVETPFGLIPTLNLEVQGDLLQLSARLFWFTGDRKHLDWGIRLGDYFLLGTNHPTRLDTPLAFSDHGCEVVNGLSELYVACAHAAPEKREQYRAPLHEMYDAILAKALDEHGLVRSLVNMKTGEHNNKLTDNWGYNLDGVYTVYLMDGTEAYRGAVRRALGSLLEHYVGYPWQGGGMDGYADSIEGAIALLNREYDESAAAWLDSEIHTLWKKQRTNGLIEAWHCDGNFARTSLMYSLWKTQGSYIRPWRNDVTFGAVRDGDAVVIALKSDQPWQGRMHFDTPRHREIMKLPMDYPRINQFPEWFTIDSNATYRVTRSGKTVDVAGSALRDGLEVSLSAGMAQVIRVEPSAP